MRSYRNELSIQIASTACLYNLTKCGWLENYKTDNISQILMSEVVELTLNAMELFPSCFQLQKNALLTLCNDSILQVHFKIFVKFIYRKKQKSTMNLFFYFFFFSRLGNKNG